MDQLASEQHDLHGKSSEVCIKTRSPPALLAFISRVTEHEMVKWTNGMDYNGLRYNPGEVNQAKLNQKSTELN